MLSYLQALEILSKRLSRPVAKLILRSEVLGGDLPVYFSEGAISEVSTRNEILQQNRITLVTGFEPSGSVPSDRILQAGRFGVGESILADISTRLGSAVAAAVCAAEEDCEVILNSRQWSGQYHLFSADLIEWADHVNWDAGTVKTELAPGVPLPSDLEIRKSKEPGSWLKIELSGMSFRLDRIEALGLSACAPSSEIKRVGGPGRLPVHDWQGALIHLIGEAEINQLVPDPDARGAQADIAKHLATWFSQHGDNSPANSQLQAVAKQILEAVRSAGRRPN